MAASSKRTRPPMDFLSSRMVSMKRRAGCLTHLGPDCHREKLRDASLGPTPQAVVEEAAVSAVRGSFQRQRGAAFGGGEGERFGREEWIVESAEQERGRADAVEETLGAGAFPIIRGVAEAVEPCGVAVVELREGPHRAHS